MRFFARAKCLLHREIEVTVRYRGACIDSVGNCTEGEGVWDASNLMANFQEAVFPEPVKSYVLKPVEEYRK